jgi:HEAT repeat protein
MAPLLTLVLAACRAELGPLPEVEGVVRQASAGDARALALLPRYFSSPVEEEVLKAYRALVEAREAAVPPLLETLQGTDPVAAEYAAGALGTIGDRRAVRPLTESLSSGRFPRYVAAWALGELRSEEAIPALVKALGDPNAGVRKYAVRSLVKFGPVVVDPVLATLDSGDPATRRYALRVLGQVEDRRAVKPVLAAFPALDREVALWALGKLGDPEALPVVASQLADGDWKIRLAAVQALGTLGDRRAVPLLEKMLEDGEWVVREWAARGLEHLTTGRQLYRDQHGQMVAPYNLYR